MKEEVLKEKIYTALAQVIDPELGIDIVSMGLIYAVNLKKLKKDQFAAVIDYTLTTAGCPLASIIQSMILDKLYQLDPKHLSKENIQLNLVFDPPWTPDMMSSEVKEKLNFFL